jgi:peptide/nickel transport system permease protein
MAPTTLDTARKRNPREDLFIATQWTLIWRKFRRHKLAMFGSAIVILFYVIALFCEFIAPHDPVKRDTTLIHVPPLFLYSRRSI